MKKCIKFLFVISLFVITSCNDDFIINDGKLGLYRGNEENVLIPNEVTVIESNAFDANICESCSKITSITIPNNVISIGEMAFNWCESLTSINIPSSVAEIGEGAFNHCKSLEKIVLPNSLAEISNGAFSNCESLKDVVLPSNITRIGEFAFDECISLTEIKIPLTVTEIGIGAFNNCKSLRKITVQWRTPINLTQDVSYIDVFNGVDAKKCKLYVPKGTSRLYKKSYIWKDFIIREY